MNENNKLEEYQIRDEAPHDHFSQIPNIVDDMHLSPYTYRLYGHLRRVSGESGKCWQNTDTLSKACDMSSGQVSKSKEELEKSSPALIRITSKRKPDGGIYHEIYIIDIWAINHDFYQKDGGVHTVNGGRSYSERTRSHGETKKNPLIQEEPTTGDKSPNTLPDTKDLPIDWKLGHGMEVTADDVARMEDNKRKDAAALISTGFGISSKVAYDLAYSFQVARNITIPEGKIKGQRKAIKEMLEMNVTPKDITEAVDELVKKNMTVVDLFSVSKTAIALANAPEKPYNPNEGFML